MSSINEAENHQKATNVAKQNRNSWVLTKTATQLENIDMKADSSLFHKVPGVTIGTCRL